MRDERWFSGEEITTLVTSPLSYANDGDDDEDEEDEEEEKKKGDEDDDEEEDEPVWTAPTITGKVMVGGPTSYQSAVSATSPDIPRDQCWRAVAIYSPCRPSRAI